MDSLAYSVMLEFKTNAPALSKELQKSFTMVDGYQKQVLKSADQMIKTSKAYHKSLNEELSLIEKIGVAFGKMAAFALTLPGKIAKAIVGLSMAVVRATSQAIINSIGHIDKYINDAMDNYSELLERYRFANIQAAGGVSLLHKNMADLMMSTGASREAAEKIAFAMIEAGFRAKEMGKDFTELSETIWGLERITGISAETTAGFAKSVMAVGLNGTQTTKMLKSFAEIMYRGNLTTAEMTKLMNNAGNELYRIGFQFGTDAITKYAKALGDVAGAAKMAGVSVDEAAQLMSDLSNDPMKFIVALGNDALYKSAGENFDTLVGKVDEIKSAVAGMPPGIMEQQMKEMYGINAAMLKVLESTSEFRKKYPALAASVGLWNEMFKEANTSLGQIWDMMYNKIMGVFNKLAQQFEEFRITFAKSFIGEIPKKLTALFESLFNLINKVFDADILGDWGKEGASWIGKLGGWIGELIDETTAWIKALSNDEGIYKINQFFRNVNNYINNELIPAAMNLWDDFEKSAKEAWVIISKYGGEAWNIISNYVRSFAEWFGGWVKNGGPQELWNKIVGIGATIYKWVSKIVEWTIWLGGTIKDWVVDPTISAIKVMLSGFKLVYNTIKWVGGAIYDYIISPITWIATELITVPIRFIKMMVEQLMTYIGQVSNFMYENIIQPTANFIAPVIDPIKSLLGYIKDAISGLFDGVGGFGKMIGEIYDSVLKKLKTISLTGEEILAEAGEYYYIVTGNTAKQAEMVEKQATARRKQANLQAFGAEDPSNWDRAAKGTNAWKAGQVGIKSEEEFKTLFDNFRKTTTSQDLNIQRKEFGGWLDKAMNAEEKTRQEMLKQMNLQVVTAKKQVSEIEKTNTLLDKNQGPSTIESLSDADMIVRNLGTAFRRENGEVVAATVDDLIKSQISRIKADAARDWRMGGKNMDDFKFDEAGQYATLSAEVAKVMTEAKAVKQDQQIAKAAESKDVNTGVKEEQVNKAVEETKGAKPVESSAHPAGMKQSPQVEHVATASASGTNINVTLKEDDLKHLGGMVEIGSKQVTLLEAIDNKMGKQLYHRNNPSSDEVTSTIWGS